ncbi:MAG: hypothetical protein GY926_15850 [bacterium]|nr:hypothetical protein [bacterium]
MRTWALLICESLSQILLQLLSVFEQVQRDHSPGPFLGSNTKTAFASVRRTDGFYGVHV